MGKIQETNPTLEVSDQLANKLAEETAAGRGYRPKPDEDVPGGWQQAVGEMRGATNDPTRARIPGRMPGSSLEGQQFAAASQTATDALPSPDSGFLQETPDGGTEFTTAFRGGFGAKRATPAQITEPEVQVADASDALRQLEEMSKGRLDDSYRDVLTKRGSDNDLKWLEDYAGSQGIVEPGELTQPQQQQEPEWWPGTGIPASAYTQAAKNIAGDVFGGLVTEGASTYLGHGVRGVENTVNGITAATGFIADYLNKSGLGLPGGIQITDPETGAFDPKLLSTDEFEQFQAKGGSSDIALPGSGLADQNQTVTGNVVGGMVQFLTGLGLVGKLTGGLSTANTVGGVSKRIGQFALADLAAWDGQEGNLANFIQSFPSLQNPVTEWLATDETTPELEGRLKNAIAAAPINVAGELVMQWLKGIKEARKLKALTQSKTVEEAVGKIETGQATLERPTVDKILGDPNGELVQSAASILRPVETGVPDQVAAKSLLPGSHRAPDVEPGKKRLYTVVKNGAEVTEEVEDLSMLQAFIQSEGGQQGVTHQIVYRDVPPGGPGPSPAAPPFSDDVFINWARINTPDDVKRAMGMMADAMAPDIQKATRGVVSNKVTEALAGNENAWALLLGERKGNLPNAQEQLAMRKLWSSSGQKLLETAKLAATGGDAEMYAFRKMMAIHNTIQQQVIGVRTETARALQQWKMPAGPENIQMAQMKLMLETGGGSDVTKELATKLALLGDNPVALEAFVRKGVFAKTASLVREYWINAMLSGPKTHMVNAMSNGVVIANTLVERMIAGQIGSVLNPVDGVRAGEATYMMMGAKEAFKDAVSSAWKVMRTGESSYARNLGIPGHEISAYTPAISAEAFDVKGNHLAKGIDMLGSFVRIPGTAMQAGDEFFKIINSRMEIWAQAMRTASEEVDRGVIPKNDPVAFKARIAEIVADPSEAIRLKAADMAAYNTFTSEPDAITKKLLELRNATPGGVIVMPFLNTPANILKYSFERTPLAPLVGRYRADMAAGGARRDLAMAKIGLGSVIMSVAYDLAMDGHVSGGGPAGDKNARERQALQRGGWQQYSARFLTGQDEDGNPTYRYFAYNRLDPVGLYFGMAADIADMARNLDYEDASARQTFEQIVVAATFSAAEGMMDKTYLSGFAGFVDAIRNADTDAYRYVRRLAGSLVPAVVAETARQMDPYAKQTSDMISQLKSRIPYLSEDVPNRLDMWGDPIGYQSGLSQAYDTLSPVYSKTTAKSSPIDREFFKLNYFPPDSVSIPLKGETDGNTLNLSLRNQPALINEFKMAAGKAGASKLLEDNEDDMFEKKGVYRSYIKTLYELGDRNMKQSLNDLVTGKLDSLSLDYEAASPEDKVEMIQDIMRAYRGAARVQILREHPELQDMRNRIPSRSSGGTEAPF